jgi:hypothetical protein
MRTCGELRNETRVIHLSILEDSSEDEDGEGRHEDMDYKTLLSFAQRIGKHNIRATREAEEDSIRRRQDTEKRATATSRPTVNSNLPPMAMETTSEREISYPTTSELG